MMKNIIISIFLLFSVLLLQAEEQKDVVLWMTEDELKACYENKEKTEQRFLIRQRGYIYGGYMGFIDGCGRVVVEPIYDSALEFSEGLARVEKNGKFGFIDKSGKVVIDFYLDFTWFFHEGKALAEIHEGNQERFYIDKNNKRYPARNEENPAEKVVRFRKHYDNLIFKEYTTGGNALAFGGLITRERGGSFQFYTDYSGQRLSVKSVFQDELVESCKNAKLLENDGNITFVKNGKTLKTIKNISAYSFPACQENLTGIVWLKKDRGVSFYENLIRAGRIFLNISEETLFIYNLDGIKIAGFENDHIIRKIEYLDENSIKVSFYDGREPEFFDLTGKKRRIEDIEEKPFWLPGIKCDFICEAERKGKKLSLEDRTKYKICPKTGYEYRDKRVDGKFVREIYNTKTGETIITIGAYASLRNYKSLEGGCLSVIETPENIYYLNDDYKVFWSGRR